jgi:hypothetical protein
MIFLCGYLQKHLGAAGSSLMGVIALLMTSLLAVLLKMALVFQLEYVMIAQRVSVIQISIKTVLPQHNLGRNCRGFLVLFHLLTVQKVVMGRTPAALN